MKKFFLLFASFILLNQLTVFAQFDSTKSERKKDDEVRTLMSSSRHFGFYASPMIKFGRVVGNNAIITGGRLGLIAGRALGFGFEGFGLVPEGVKTDNATGRRMRSVGGMGGLFLEPIVASNRVVHLTFPVGIGLGWHGYFDYIDNTWQEGELIEGDVFGYVEPSIHVELNLTRFLRIGATGAYRIASAITLPDTDSNAMNGANFGAYIKIGRF